VVQRSFCGSFRVVRPNGQKIRTLRRRKGLTLNALAQRAGVAEKTLRLLEGSQTATPHPDTIAAVAGALNVSTEALFDGPDEDPAVVATPPNEIEPARQEPWLARMMAPSPPHDWVPRDEELALLRAHLLVDAGGSPPLLALHAAGGFGKTTFAQAVAHDPRVRAAWPDGVLWLTLGEQGDPLGALTKLHAALSPNRRHDFVDLEDATHAVADRLADRRCLLIIDDVWSSAHLLPIIAAAPHCACLVTTRDAGTIPVDARVVRLAAMSREAAATLLSRGIEELPHDRLHEVARRTGGWPLLLRLANAALRRRVERLREPAARALDYVARSLDRYGVTGFDQSNASDRHQAVSRTIDASLELLAPADRDRYAELAIFCEDTPVPLAMVQRLWRATAHHDELATERLCEQLYELSLLADYDAERLTIGLHQVLRDLLHRRLGEQNAADLHRQLLDSWLGPGGDGSSEGWVALLDESDAASGYLVEHLAYHMTAAGRHQQLHALLLDFDWIRVRSRKHGIHGLRRDRAYLPGHPELEPVLQALTLAQPYVDGSRQALASQLWARLAGPPRDARLDPLLDGARARTPRPWLRPLRTSLTTPGRGLQRIFRGHGSAIAALRVTPDDEHVVALTLDQTLIIRNLGSGAAKRLGRRRGASFSFQRGQTLQLDPLRARAVVGRGSSVALWDWATGVLSKSIDVDGAIDALALTKDGRYVLVAGSGPGRREPFRSFRLFSIASGLELRQFGGHAEPISQLEVTAGDQRVVSSSWDHTLALWDFASGEMVHLLEGHTDAVTCFALARDGRVIVSTSLDGTIRVWDLQSGGLLRCMAGAGPAPARALESLALVDDDRGCVGAGADGTVTLWDLESGRERRRWRAHATGVTALLPYHGDADLITGAEDGSMRVWQVARTEPEPAGSAAITSVALDRLGTILFSADAGGAIAVRRVEDGQSLRTLHARDCIHALCPGADGLSLAAAGADGTITLWSLADSTDARVLAAHDGAVLSLVASGQDPFLISGSADRSVGVWDRHTLQRVRRLPINGAASALAQTEPDILCVGDSTGSITVWRLTTAECLLRFDTGGEWIHALAHVPGTTLVCCATDAPEIAIYDCRSGRPVGHLKGHRSAVQALTACASSDLLISASADGTVKLWSISSRSCLATFRDESPLRTLAAAARAHLLTAGGDSGQLHLLSLERADR
jgi:WD40 repeat protein/transcriptional regulator with XRE-family HTH domain